MFFINIGFSLPDDLQTNSLPGWFFIDLLTKVIAAGIMQT